MDAKNTYVMVEMIDGITVINYRFYRLCDMIYGENVQTTEGLSWKLHKDESEYWNF
jgi:hypothetical protein